MSTEDENECQSPSIQGERWRPSKLTDNCHFIRLESTAFQRCVSTFAWINRRLVKYANTAPTGPLSAKKMNRNNLFAFVGLLKQVHPYYYVHVVTWLYLTTRIDLRWPSEIPVIKKVVGEMIFSVSRASDLYFWIASCVIRSIKNSRDCTWRSGVKFCSCV